MNILSLFDGISCGQLALARSGIANTGYYASEIDKHALDVTMSNFPSTTQLGDAKRWQVWELPKIDLLIGGSPCQGFSFIGKRLAFADNHSSLFWIFVDALNHYQPSWWLFENVTMLQENIDVISACLGTTPNLICSSHFSAQNRRRLYWTNIHIQPYHDNKAPTITDVLHSDAKAFGIRTTRRDRGNRRLLHLKGAIKSPTLTSAYEGGILSDGRPFVLFDNREDGELFDYVLPHRKLTPIECERLQTLPDNYTAKVNKTQRYKLLGNSWTVDVIAHILRGINKSPKRQLGFQNPLFNLRAVF